MDVKQSQLRAGALMSRAAKDLSHRPFVVLLGLNALVSVVTATLGAEDTELVTWLLLAVLSVYIQIATLLAAGSANPDPSGDSWMRAAFRARCFWRFVVVELFIFVSVGLGLFVLVIGAVVIGSYVALSEQAVVLERLGIVAAISRGADIAQGNRKAIGVVFALLILLPNVVLPLAYVAGLDDTAPERIAVSLVTVVVATVGTIALTRAFVELGGKPAPAPGEVRRRTHLP